MVHLRSVRPHLVPCSDHHRYSLSLSNPIDDYDNDNRFADNDLLNLTERDYGIASVDDRAQRTRVVTYHSKGLAPLLFGFTLQQEGAGSAQ